MLQVFWVLGHFDTICWIQQQKLSEMTPRISTQLNKTKYIITQLPTGAETNSRRDSLPSLSTNDKWSGCPPSTQVDIDRTNNCMQQVDHETAGDPPRRPSQETLPGDPPALNSLPPLPPSLPQGRSKQRVTDSRNRSR